MSRRQQQPIEVLIERSSLGSRDAQRTRAGVPAATGRALAKAAAARAGKATHSSTIRAKKIQG